MTTVEPSVFDRIVPRQELFRGSGWSALVWSVLAALLTAGAIITAGLLLRVCTAPQQVASSEVVVIERWLSSGSLSQDTIDLKLHPMAVPGLLAVALADREQWWGPLVLKLAANFPALRSTSACLQLLVVLWAILWYAARSANVRSEAATLRLSFELAGRLRSGVHRQVLRTAPGDLTGSVVKQSLDLFTRDIDEIRQAVQLWTDAWVRMPVWLTVMNVLGLALQLSVFFYASVPLTMCWLFLQSEGRSLRRRKELTRLDSERELRLLAESLTRARLTKGYGMEDAERESFDKALVRYQSDAARLVQPLGIRDWGIRIGTWVCGIVVAYVISVKLVSDPLHLNLVIVAMLTSCLWVLYLALEHVQLAIRTRNQAVSAALRVQRFLDRIPEVSQAVGAKFLEPLSKSIELYQVTYGLPGQNPPLLDLLSLSLPAGKQVAIIGTDERAARALTSLLPRFIDPQSGQVLFDGEDIAWVTLESLRSETAWVGSGPEVLFTGTVLENIVAGLPNQSLSDVTQAAKIAHAHHFIQKLAQGYETVLGEHGETLDAGQTFRLSLARALLRNPALLIIEEPDQLLDDDTKSMIDDTYGRIAAKRTIIFLPTRLTTLRRCDEVILLHQGQVAARGVHAELVRKSQLYRHWEYVHFNEFRHDEGPA